MCFALFMHITAKVLWFFPRRRLEIFIIVNSDYWITLVSHDKFFIMKSSVYMSLTFNWAKTLTICNRIFFTYIVCVFSWEIPIWFRSFIFKQNISHEKSWRLHRAILFIFFVKIIWCFSYHLKCFFSCLSYWVSFCKSNLSIIFNCFSNFWWWILWGSMLQSSCSFNLMHSYVS